MELGQAYKYIAINVGEMIKRSSILRDIKYSQQIYLSKIGIEEFPNNTITSERQKTFYDSVLSLAKARLSNTERNKMLKDFIKEIIKGNQQKILSINNIIRKTGYTELLIETEGIIKIDINVIDNLNIDVIDSHINKCKTKIINRDYTGAITNARSLLGIVYLKIIKDNKGDINLFKGDLNRMYSTVKAILQRKNEQDQVIQLLAGFASITNGISSLSNTPLSDRHGHLEENNSKTYAELIVNLVFSLSSFFIEIM